MIADFICWKYLTALLACILSNHRFAKTHGKYSEVDLNIELSHREPENFTDKSALFAVRCVRFFFDAGKCDGSAGSMHTLQLSLLL